MREHSNSRSRGRVSSPRAAYTIVGGRFVDGAAPEKDKRTAI